MVENLYNLDIPDDFEYLMEGAWDEDLFDSFFEGSSESTDIRDQLYPKFEKGLSDPVIDRKFRLLVEKYLDRNANVLHEPGPITRLLFLETDKNGILELFGTTQKEIKDIVTVVTKKLNDKSQFRLAINNPIFVAIWCIIRYYTIKKDEKGINIALAIYACAAYPSIFDKYFKHGANRGVMMYTIDNLTNKFTFKLSTHTFGALMTSIQASYKFLKPFFLVGTDKECIRWIQRVRNDQNSMIKKVCNEYMKNHAKGLTVSITADSFEDNSFVDTVENNTSIVDVAAQKVVLSMLTNNIDLQLAETSAKWSQISVVDCRFYLTKIITKDNESMLNAFIESVLFIYLYDEKHKPEEIKSKLFLSYGIDLFRRTNSNDPNIRTIKESLDKWARDAGIYDRFKREASKINYKKSIFWYILLSIQKLS